MIRKVSDLAPKVVAEQSVSARRGRSVCGDRLFARPTGICYGNKARTETFGSSWEQYQVTLTVTMLRCPDTVAPETRVLQGGEFSIGRGSENDWVLPDRERFLSKRHCILAYRSGSWQIADLSTNGTFLNGEAAPVGHAQPRDLHDGDRLRLGDYEIELRIAKTAMPARAPLGQGDPFALDPFAPPLGPATGHFDPDPLLPRRPGQDPFAEPFVSASINVPPDNNPFTPEPGEVRFAGPTQPDHSPHIEDVFRPGLPHSLLPDDWDHEPAPQPPTPPAVAGSALASGLTDTPAAVAVGPPEASLVKDASPVTPPPVSAPPIPSAAVIRNDDLLAAFLRGTGLPDARPADPVAAMEALGAAFRALISGLRLAMIARSAIKGEFRIEQTMIRSRGNNPLKFSADDDDAMLALLGAGRRTGDGPRRSRGRRAARHAPPRDCDDRCDAVGRARDDFAVRPGQAPTRRRAKRSEPRAGAAQSARLGRVRGALCPNEPRAHR